MVCDFWKKYGFISHVSSSQVPGWLIFELTCDCLKKSSPTFRTHRNPGEPCWFRNMEYGLWWSHLSRFELTGTWVTYFPPHVWLPGEIISHIPGSQVTGYQKYGFTHFELTGTRVTSNMDPSCTFRADTFRVTSSDFLSLFMAALEFLNVNSLRDAS